VATILAKATNGFTAAQIDRALQGLDLPLLVRIRAELLDLDNQLLFPLDGLQLEGEITHNVTQPMQRGANLRFRATPRDSQHSAPLGTFAATVLAQARLFWLRLNEASGNALDSSGNSRTFTANGGITYSIGSLGLGDPVDNAIKLNGSTGYYSIAHAAWQDVTTGLSVILARRGTDTGDIPFESTGSHKLQVNTGVLEWAITFTVGGTSVYSTGVNVADNLPHLIHATYNGAYVNIYVDGKRVVHTAETRTITAGTGLLLGKSGSTFSSSAFDEVGMLNRALSPKEVRDEYQAWSGQTDELLLDRDRADRVKIYYGIRMPSNGTDGTDTAEWPQIVGVMTSPRQDYVETGTLINIACQDQTRVLQDYTFSSVNTLASGGNYISGTGGVLYIAALAGFNTAAWAVTSTALTAPADIPFEIGHSALDAINYLLGAINYKPIRFSGDGTAIIEPNKLDKDLPLSDVINTTTTKVIDAETLSLEFEPRKVPQRVLIGNGNPDATPLLGSATINQGISPISLIYPSSIVWVFQVDAPDQTTADDIAEQVLADAVAGTAKRIRFRTLPRPIHDDRDRYDLTIPEIGIPTVAAYVEEEWSLPLNGTPMSHSMLSVVDVS